MKISVFKKISCAFVLVFSMAVSCASDLVRPIPESIYSMNLERLKKTQALLRDLKIGTRANPISIDIKSLLMRVNHAKNRESILQVLAKLTGQEDVERRDYSVDDKYKYEQLIKLLGFSSTSDRHLEYKNTERDWLRKIAERVEKQISTVEHQHTSDGRITFAQALLFEEGKNQAGFTRPSVAISYSGSGSYTSSLRDDSPDLFCMKNSSDFEINLFLLYHELGHAMHNDCFASASLGDARKNYADFLSDPLFEADTKKIGGYTQLGQKVVDESSTIGSIIKDAIARVHRERMLEAGFFGSYESVFFNGAAPVIGMAAPILIPMMALSFMLKESKNPRQAFQDSLDVFFNKILKDTKALRERYPFWIQPENSYERIKYSYFRGTEQRADLFACEHLLRQNRIDAIIRWIEWLVTYYNDDKKIISYKQIDAISKDRPHYEAGTQSQHPSDLERAVYSLGFLAAHGVDVNAALRDYELRGTCTDAEDPKFVFDYIRQNKNVQCAVKN